MDLLYIKRGRPAGTAGRVAGEREATSPNGQGVDVKCVVRDPAVFPCRIAAQACQPLDRTALGRSKGFEERSDIRAGPEGGDRERLDAERRPDQRLRWLAEHVDHSHVLRIQVIPTEEKHCLVLCFPLTVGDVDLICYVAGELRISANLFGEAARRCAADRRQRELGLTPPDQRRHFCRKLNALLRCEAPCARTTNAETYPGRNRD